MRFLLLQGERSSRGAKVSMRKKVDSRAAPSVPALQEPLTSGTLSRRLEASYSTKFGVGLAGFFEKPVPHPSVYERSCYALVQSYISGIGAQSAGLGLHVRLCLLFLHR